MSVPKKRRTPSSKGKRRSHHALNSTVLIKCEKCSTEIVPHSVCGVCGTYKGKTVVNMETKAEAKKAVK